MGSLPFSISLVRTGFPFDLVSASSCVSEMAETKDGLTHLERVDDAFPDSHDEKVASNQEELDIDPVYSYKEQRAIIRRVDRRLIVTAGIIYMNSLMDRSNLPNAGIAGMNADLEMVGTRYSVVALVFFITYTIFQPPATILTRKIGPRTFLSAIVWPGVLLWSAFPLLRNGGNSYLYALFLVSLKRDTSPALYISSQHGTPATTCRNAMPASMHLGSWPPDARVFWLTA